MFIVYNKRGEPLAAFNDWYRAFTCAYRNHGYYDWWQ